jgi:hypothetical protein
MENKKETSVTVQEKNISEGVLSRVKELEKEGNLQFPANYSYSNAIKSAWLILQETVDRDKKPVLQSLSYPYTFRLYMSAVCRPFFKNKRHKKPPKTGFLASHLLICPDCAQS